jgi:Na+-translocating ferredoxin:NAD+ oxidoreductase RnfG subunit
MIDILRRIRMSRKLIVTTLTLFAVMLVTTIVCFAFTLLTKEKALKEVFWSGAQIESETVELSGDTLENIKKRLGGSLVYEQQGSESAKVSEKHSVEFHFGLKDGKKRGVAIIDVEPGKWGPVEFITAMDLKGTVKRVKVMSYQEQRGRPIARNSFLNQYRGKSSRSTMQVGKDIIGVSGATISSRSATFAVKKAIVMYEEVYLKK